MNARKVLSSVFFNYVGAISASLIGFVATPIILHHLGKPVFGAWALIAAVIGYSSLLDLGVGLTVMRMVAERAHLSDRSELRSIVGTALVIYSIAGLVVALIAIGLTPALGSIFHVPGRIRHDFTISFVIIAVVLGLTFPSGLYTGINQGFARFRQQNMILVGQTLGGTLTTIVIVLLGGGLIPLAIGWAICVLLGFTAKVVYAARAYGITPSPRRFERHRARSLMGVSVWMFIINLANKVIWNTDVIVVGSVLGPTPVAHYTVALGPATAVRTVTDQFNSVTYSAAASLRAQNEHRGLHRLLLEATRVVTVFIVPFVVLFLLWGRQFLGLWVGPSLESSAPTLVVLVIGMLSTSVQATSTQILMAFEMQRRMAWVAILEACANLICSIVLAHSIGIEGVALGTTIPTTITAFGYYLPTATRLLGIPLTDVLRRLVPPLVLSADAYVVFSRVIPPIRFTSLLEFMCFVAGFIGVLVIIGIALDGEERSTYAGVIRSWRHRAPKASAPV
jgi:O-antigen/teichoic acid export membrane protein